MINKDELKNALKLYLVTDSDILKGREQTIIELRFGLRR